MKVNDAFTLIFAFLFIIFCPAYLLYSTEKNNVIPVSIIGVHHLGSKYSISEFYLNKHGGTGVQREGGGGGLVCCVMIPAKWRRGIEVEVRWSIESWSHENRAEIKSGEFRSVGIEETYLANVPLEKYEQPGDLYIHFFSHGKVRIVSTMHAPNSHAHPVPWGEGEGGPVATKGEPIREIFTSSELQKMKQGDRKSVV